MADRDVLDAKVQSIGRCLERIEEWKPASADELERHGVLDGDLAERLRRAVGFRNVSVHEYDEVDWRLVYRLVSERLGDFRSFVSRISEAWL